MNKRVIALSLVLIGVALLVGLHFSRRRVQEQTAATGNSRISPTAASTARTLSSTTVLPSAPATGRNIASNSGSPIVPAILVPATPYLLGSADKAPPMEPVTLLDNMRRAINQYRSMFGGNPVGTNP